MSLVDEYFDAIQNGDIAKVRDLLAEHKHLTTEKKRVPNLKFPEEIEQDGFKFCGAYLGQVSGLQLAIILNQDEIAEAIVDATLSQDIDMTIGGQNTALHLACLYGYKGLVQSLLSRGANREAKNTKGFTALSISDDPEVTSLFASL